MHRLSLLPVVFALATSAALAEASAPTATTATYGNWTLGCSTVTPADGSAPQPFCEMTTRLNLKGQDGQLRPLLQMSIGQPPGAKALRLAVQVPGDVALRDGVTLGIDKPADAGTDPAAVKPQDQVLALTYLTCGQKGCVADADGSADLWTRLQAEKTVNVGFTVLAGAKKILVPVSLDGFAAAFAALQANLK